MARRYARRVNNRVNNRSSRQADRQAYVYGSAVRKPAYAPEEYPQPLRPVTPKKKRKNAKVAKAARRRKQLFVGLLSLCVIIFCLSCVGYVNLQAEITKSAKQIAKKQEKLSKLKEVNDAKYNKVMDSVNMDDVRKKAIDDLGMVYASNDQIVTYDSVDSDFVEQYEEIPENGVLASDEGK